MYPLGVTTIEGAAQTIYTLYKLYNEARDYSAKVAAADRLLQSIHSTLKCLEATGNEHGSEQSSPSHSQVAAARDAWTDLDEYFTAFRNDHDLQASSVQKACHRIQWAVDRLDGKVSDMQLQVNSCLLAIMPNQMAEIR